MDELSGVETIAIKADGTRRKKTRQMLRDEGAQTEKEESSAGADFKAAARQQTSLLAPAERACLNWLVRRLPSWVMPDHLTLLGFAAMGLAGACYALALWWPPSLLIVNFWLAVNWFGDSLDGTLARARDKQRPRYGFYVDHMADAFGTLFIVCGLALSGYMTGLVAMAVMVVYSLLSINVYLATYTMGIFKLSFWKFSPTELRILIALGNIRAFFRPEVVLRGESYLFYDVAAVAAIAAMGIVLMISVARNTMALYRAERV
ncbi:MAG: CDP-alcohol phosphatidyltransferase family protein [Blastocatellia bacterium]|nr:CDP-alcohol phosphatidyltransferase family protein [Blastocatellia bacterium]